MARRGWVVGLLIATVVGCGGGDSVDPAEDEDRIQDALLTLGDLPDGFKEEPVDDDEENDASDECNEEVLGLEPNEVNDTKTAETDEVQFQSETLSIRAQVSAFDDPDLPRQILEAFEDNDDYLDCFIDKFMAEVSDDVRVDDVSTEDVLIDDEAVDAGVTLVVELDVGGVAAEALDLPSLIDRYTIALDVTARAEDMDTDVAVDALEAMVARLSDN